MKNYVNYTGGAKGSDEYWESIGNDFGVTTVRILPRHVIELGIEDRAGLELDYQRVVSELGRKLLPADTYSGMLVRRDLIQAYMASAIYAIGYVVKRGQRGHKGFLVDSLYEESVDGGSGYACQMGIIQGKPVYVFDQNDSKWKVWTGDRFEVFASKTPMLTQAFAGIGTRHLNDDGRRAIIAAYAKTSHFLHHEQATHLPAAERSNQPEEIVGTA